MKKIILTLAIIITYSCSSAQTVVDMATSHEVNWSRKNGQYYLKDVNNYMQPYIGTWQYINGNEEFIITLTKIEMHHENQDNDDYYIDGINISYQKYENGILIYQSPPNIDYPSGIIKEFGKLRLTFTDYERVFKNEPLNASRNAGHEAHLDLIDNGNGSYNLKFKLFTEQEHPNLGITYEPVTNGDPYHSTPTDIVMTKM